MVSELAAVINPSIGSSVTSSRFSSFIGSESWPMTYVCVCVGGYFRHFQPHKPIWPWMSELKSTTWQHFIMRRNVGEKVVIGVSIVHEVFCQGVCSEIHKVYCVGGPYGGSHIS